MFILDRLCKRFSKETVHLRYDLLNQLGVPEFFHQKQHFLSFHTQGETATAEFQKLAVSNWKFKTILSLNCELVFFYLYSKIKIIV